LGTLSAPRPGAHHAGRTVVEFAVRYAAALALLLLPLAAL
jgi:hypothetical protein